MNLTVVKRKKQSESSLDPDEKTFNRLKTKIARLQEAEVARLNELDEALKFYHTQIQPQEQALAKELAERARITYKIYTTNKLKFSSQEREGIRGLILEDIDTLQGIISLGSLPQDIHEIFEALKGVKKDSSEEMETEFEAMKRDLEHEFKAHGFKLDLSGINVNDKYEDMLEKMLRSAHSSMEEQIASGNQNPQTKKQLEKERKRQKLEELQSRGLNTIYKQLAKAFHPDLEPDADRKKQKEELMKKLTVAYEEKDLFTLLAIEQEWIRSYEGKVSSKKELKAFNAILKDQVEALEARIDMLILRPIYFALHTFYPGPFTGIGNLIYFFGKIQMEVASLRRLVQQLHTPQARTLIKQALQEEAAFRVEEDRFNC